MTHHEVRRTNGGCWRTSFGTLDKKKTTISEEIVVLFDSKVGRLGLEPRTSGLKERRHSQIQPLSGDTDKALTTIFRYKIAGNSSGGQNRRPKPRWRPIPRVLGVVPAGMRILVHRSRVA